MNEYANAWSYIKWYVVECKYCIGYGVQTLLNVPNIQNNVYAFITPNMCWT